MQVSYIIPVYNCEKYLEECVQSILKQEEIISFEILLVDDGSKDKSGSIADRLAQLYENVFSYHKENGGASSARNYGIARARGEYIVFVDGDDTLACNFTKEINKVICSGEEEESLVIFGMSFDYYKNGRIVRNEILSCSEKGTFSKEKVLENYQRLFFDNALSSACNKVFRRDILCRNGILFNEKMTLYEDYEFVLRYLSTIKSVSFVNIPLYHYRNDLDKVHINTRVQNLTNLYENMNCLLTTMLPIWENEKGMDDKQILTAGANLYMQMLSQHLINNTDESVIEQNMMERYCVNPVFASFLTYGAILEEQAELLLKDIRKRHFRKVFLRYRYKRFKSRMRKMLKRALILTGIRS